MVQHVRLIERGATPEENREIAIQPSEFLMGRGADCNLRLPDAAISRHHCIIRISADEVSVIDLGSSNGTYLNGQRVRSQAVLHSGDDLQVGPCHFLVSLGDTSDAELQLDRGVDPLAVTRRVRDVLPKRSAEGEKEEGHPRGEAGGDKL